MSSFTEDYFNFRSNYVKIERWEINSIRRFSEYADKRRVHIITRQFINDFLDAKKNPSRTYKFSTIKHIRPFSKFLHIQDSRHFVPEYRFVSRPKRLLIPYIFNEQQVAMMMNYARNELWKGPQRLLVPATYETLIGLLWTTGMRISEAKNLNIGDIDFEQNIIHIRETKFYKSRILPVQKSTGIALKNYLIERNSFKYPCRSDCPFFFNWAQRQRKSGRYTVGGFHNQLRKVILALDIKGENGKHARPYDLRHSFATTRLTTIYESALSIQKLPIVATYMGHSKFSHTQVYLHPSTELLASLGKNFFSFFEKGARA